MVQKEVFNRTGLSLEFCGISDLPGQTWHLLEMYLFSSETNQPIKFMHLDFPVSELDPHHSEWQKKIEVYSLGMEKKKKT